jgi:hypothetical protein
MSETTVTTSTSTSTSTSTVTTSVIPISSVSYKFSEEDMAMFNSISNPNRKRDQYLAIGGMGAMSLFLIILLIIGIIWSILMMFNKYDTSDYISTFPKKILVNKIYIPIQILLFIYALAIGIYNIGEVSSYDDKLFELYRKITDGTDISYEVIIDAILQKNIKNNKRYPKSGIEEAARNQIINNNYYNIFKDVLDNSKLKVIDTNAKLGMGNLIGSIACFILFGAVCIKLL